MSYSYSTEDDILACYVSKYGEEIFISAITASKKKGMLERSFKARVANFDALGGKGKLSHAANNSKVVYADYQGVSQTEHRRKCFEILGISK